MFLGNSPHESKQHAEDSAGGAIQASGYREEKSAGMSLRRGIYIMHEARDANDVRLIRNLNRGWRGVRE